MLRHGNDADLGAMSWFEAEQMLHRLRYGILAGSLEVKCDEAARRTGNLYFEHACRYPSDGWAPSGIATTPADSWVHVAWPLILATPTWVARRVAALGEPRELRRGSHPTQGRVLEVGDFARRCAEVGRLA